jgi:hypothetical protein
MIRRGRASFHELLGQMMILPFASPEASILSLGLNAAESTPLLCGSLSLPVSLYSHRYTAPFRSPAAIVERSRVKGH